MDKQIGPYSIVRLIGTGGSGSVYEGLHSQIQRRAAIKVLHKDFQQDAEFVQRFFNEAKAVNIINHPNIVSINEVGTTASGSPYIVMEFLEGDSLRQRMARSDHMAPELVMRIGKQVAAGLAAAHAKHVVHRDLKPVNIMLVPDAEGSDSERAKILDFGIAKLTDEPGKSLTRLGVSLGTPGYMSPEQCKNSHDVSDRSDVYALGVVLYEMLAGEHPFADALSADSAMMASHIGKEPTRIESKAPGTPPELSALVHRLLAKQPDARPSAGEVAATLGRLTGSTTGLQGVVLGPPERGGAPGELALAATATPRQVIGRGFFSDLFGKLPGGSGLFIAAGVALVLGIVGMVVVGRALFDSGAQVAERVRWSIVSEPSGAEVVDATGQVVGLTPLEHSLPRGTRIEIVSLRKDGYAEQRLPLDCSHDGSRSLTLTPLPKPPAEATIAASQKPQEKSDVEKRGKRKSKKKSAKTRPKKR